MKKIITVLAIVGMMANVSQATLIINTLGTPTSATNLSTWDGDAAPPNFTSSGITWDGYYDLDGAYSSTNRAYAFRETETGPVVGLGNKRGTSGGVFLNLQVTNDTGGEITQFDLSWTAAQYTEWGRATTFFLNNYNVENSGWTTVGLTSTTFTASAQAAPTPSSGENLDTIVTSAQSGSIVFATPLAHGESLAIGFSFGNGAGSEGNAHVGFTDMTITAIPEPSTLALFGLMIGALAFARRRLHR